MKSLNPMGSNLCPELSFNAVCEGYQTEQEVSFSQGDRSARDPITSANIAAPGLSWITLTCKDIVKIYRIGGIYEGIH